MCTVRIISGATRDSLTSGAFSEMAMNVRGFQGEEFFRFRFMRWNRAHTSHGTGIYIYIAYLLTPPGHLLRELASKGGICLLFFFQKKVFETLKCLSKFTRNTVEKFSHSSPFTRIFFFFPKNAKRKVHGRSMMTFCITLEKSNSVISLPLYNNPTDPTR